MNLPRLYKSTKTGATQICDISYSEDQFHVTFGQLDGKLQTKSTTCKPTNVGRSNERSTSQQAKFEAEAKHVSKIKSGYSESLEAPSEIQLPQKVKPYVGNENKIKFPAYSLPKLNGINGTYWLLPDGSLKLTSRGGNEYPPIPHLEKQTLDAMEFFGTTCLNGELYIHGQYLEDITSAVKKSKELSKQLEFHIFGLPLVDGNFCDHSKQLYNYHVYSSKIDSLFVKAILPLWTNSEIELEEFYNEAIEDGYEGTVIYNADSVYKFNERSSSVFKYKKAIDAEFQVVGYEFDKNNHVVYTCKTSDNNQFKVKRKGTNEQRDLDAKQASNNLDKWLTVEFEMYSKKDIPLKGVGLNFRDCDINGEPNE